MKNHKEDFAELLGRYQIRTGLTQQELANKIGMHRNTIVKWMNRTSWPESRGQVLRLADELSLMKEERKALILAAGFSVERWPTEVWTIPQQRDMFFTGRDDVFQSLRQRLVPGSMTALTQAISGLGGIGKTHTAVEYVYRFHHYYEAILFLQADSWEILISACIKLADELGLPEQKETDQIVEEVRLWLQKHRLWLLILDNVENPQEILPNFVPAGHQGSVLVTTRVHDVEPLAETQVLSTMSEKEAILFLLHRTKKVALAAGLEQANSAQYDEAKEIWKLMDGLPLALDQAGAYILETGCSFSAYREQYIRRSVELLHRRGKRFIGHKASVTTTFSLVFEQVEALNPLAADILRVCSLLYSEAIPEELFREGTEYLSLDLMTGNGNLDLAVGLQQDYSLVQRNTDAKTLTMHRLVQTVLKDGMDERTEHQWAERTVRAVEHVFPDPNELENWSICERYLQHAQASAGLIQKLNMIFTEAAQLLHKAGSYLYLRAQYPQAETLFQQALRIWEDLHGSEHPNVALGLNNLAVLYRKQGKFAVAKPLYQQALAIREQALGSEHLSVAESLNNLAGLYKSQGEYGEAEPLYQRALTIRENVLGPDDTEVALTLNDLAGVYEGLGKYSQAEPLWQRALSIQEKILGTEHPAVAANLTNLAHLYWRQNEYTQAEPLHQRALSIFEGTLGPSHPNVAHTLNNLATVYLELGKYDQAEPLLQRALTIWIQTFGNEHIETANTLSNLAIIYDRQHRYEEAEPLYRRALEIDERVLGPDHMRTAVKLYNLAGVYKALDKYAQAEPLYWRSVEIHERVLGSEHADVARPLNNLANLYHKWGKYTKAEQLYQRALAIREKTLKPEHPYLANSLNNLAELYHAQGKYEQAEPLYQRALEIREKQLGPEHPDTAQIINNLATLYYAQAKYDQAEPLFQQALTIMEKQLGPEHPDTATSLNNLARLYDSQNKYEQAESLYRRALIIDEQAYGPDHPDVATILNNLADFYRRQGKYDQAETLFQQALTIMEKQLGPEHPRTVETRRKYAHLLRACGRPEEAAELEAASVEQATMSCQEPS